MVFRRLKKALSKFKLSFELTKPNKHVLNIPRKNPVLFVQGVGKIILGSLLKVLTPINVPNKGLSHLTTMILWMNVIP
jgi:hypothetical protein